MLIIVLMAEIFLQLISTSFLLQVTSLGLLGDNVHSTCIAFVEFAMVSWCLQNRFKLSLVQNLLDVTEIYDNKSVKGLS